MASQRRLTATDAVRTAIMFLDVLGVERPIEVMGVYAGDYLLLHFRDVKVAVPFGEDYRQMSLDDFADLHLAPAVASLWKGARESTAPLPPFPPGASGERACLPAEGNAA